MFDFTGKGHFGRKCFEFENADSLYSLYSTLSQIMFSKNHMNFFQISTAIFRFRNRHTIRERHKKRCKKSAPIFAQLVFKHILFSICQQFLGVHPYRWKDFCLYQLHVHTSMYIVSVKYSFVCFNICNFLYVWSGGWGEIWLVIGDNQFQERL